MGASSRRECPACGADSIRLSVTNVRRKRRVTCTQCGAKLEVVIDTGFYALVTLTAVILASMLLPAMVAPMLEKRWGTIVLAVALLFALIFGSNVLLNRRATVQRAPGPGVV